MLSDTCASWMRSMNSCFGRGDKSSSNSEKETTVISRDQQPPFIPPSYAEPVFSNERSFGQTLERQRGRSRSIKGARPSRGGSFSRSRTRWLSRSASRPRQRPTISAPTNFRHVHSESFQYPSPGDHPSQLCLLPQPQPQLQQQQEQQQQQQQLIYEEQQQSKRLRPSSFHPIELSIRASPLLPHFVPDENEPANRITPPPPAHLAENSSITQWDVSDATMGPNDVDYPTTFNVPRRSVGQVQQSSSNSQFPPRIPPKSRARAYTAPSTELMLERIASAMLEKEKLQAEIDELVERQSVYKGSRPGTPVGYRASESMPVFDVPAIPAAAPSFAERVSYDERRPKTAPSSSQPQGPGTFSEMNAGSATPDGTKLGLAAAAFTSHPPMINFAHHWYGQHGFDHGSNVERTSPSPASTVKAHESRSRPSTVISTRPAPPQRIITSSEFDRPLAPPLPLVLRPPLRKKKSFSRVSNWLFPGTGNVSDSNISSPTDTYRSNSNSNRKRREDSISKDSITNVPRPIKESEGYYQCFSPSLGNQYQYQYQQQQQQHERDNSSATSSSLSSWRSEEEEVPTTTWSMGSSPVRQTPGQTPKQTPVLSAEEASFAVSAAFAATVSPPSSKTEVQQEREQGASVNGSSEGEQGGGDTGTCVTITGLKIPEHRNGHRPQSVGVAF
ncbi:hypothetical protein B0T20DRAFT_349333 [Sordaria brevicollis]|uniref:Uncharacterized protein n=1 Tax=Sordaria brevicollis TaxID=83679 RepID=A0AAE0PIE7_SORBR|nr:hypothetical protein B0T20DRAFT_349333 [Sordaria brevicollis]